MVYAVRRRSLFLLVAGVVAELVYIHGSHRD